MFGNRLAGSKLHFAMGLAGCLFVVLGAKLWLIGSFGSSVPYWDQWAEAALYRRYLTGTLTPSELLAQHNEHRILFTRLSGLALLTLTGQWDPLIQMIANAVVHTLALGILIIVLGRQLGIAYQLALAVFCMVIHALPFGWENTLWGFQIQFYLLLLFSAASMALLFDAEAWSTRWWLGTLFAIASFFNTASGALTLGASLAVAAAQIVLRQRRGAGEFAALALHAVLIAVMVADIPLARHASMAARSIEHNFVAFVTTAGWPLVTPDWMVRYRVLAVLLINTPLLLVALSVLRDRPGLPDRRWCMLSLGAWAALQMAAISHGRATFVWASRYFDIFTVGLVVNAACLLALLRMGWPGRTITMRIAATLWFVAILVGLAEKMQDKVLSDITRKSVETRIQAENVKNFLARGDVSHLRSHYPMHIPHPSAEDLRDVLSDPAIRTILPPSLFGQPDQNQFKRAVLHYGPMCFPLGLALVMIAAIAAFGRSRHDQKQRQHRAQ